MLHRVPEIADRALARENAGSVADLIGAHVKTRKRIVFGEPDCPYELRWNTEFLWFGVQISDHAYVVRGNHKRRFETSLEFCASFKEPNPAMRTGVPLHSLSEELRVPVFVAEPSFGPAVAGALRSAPCGDMLARIDFGSIKSMFLSPVQLYAISDLVSPEHCAEQIALFRNLLLSLSQRSSQNVSRSRSAA